MVRTITAAALAALVTSNAWSCENVEYAQVRDRTKTRADQMLLARRFCLARDLQQIRRGVGDHTGAAVCGAEMSKLLDALSAAKATAAIQYIEKTCPLR